MENCISIKKMGFDRIPLKTFFFLLKTVLCVDANSVFKTLSQTPNCLRKGSCIFNCLCWLVGWLILATFLKVKKFTLQEYYLNVLIILPTFQKLPARAVYDFKAQTSK